MHPTSKDRLWSSLLSSSTPCQLPQSALLFSTALLLWLPCSLLDTPGGSKFVLANRFLFRGVHDGHNMDTDLTALYSLPNSCFFLLTEESVWSLGKTLSNIFFSLSGIFLFLRNINIFICDEETKSSPASCC